MASPAASRTDDVFQVLADEKYRLLGYIRQRTDDAAEIEDIYQEALMKVAKRLEAGHTVTDPIKYVYRVIANIIKDNYRRRQGNSPEALTDDILCQRPLPDQHLEAQERLDIFMAYLNTLPAKTRRIIILRKLHGESYAKIADDLGISRHSAEKRLNRAMRTLEEMMTRQVVNKQTRSELRVSSEKLLYE